MPGQRVIVVEVDRSARSRVAADWAAREARWRGLPLRVVHVAAPDALDAPRPKPGRPASVTPQVAAELAAELTHRHPDVRIVTDTARLTGAAVPEPYPLCQDAEIVVLGLPGEDELSGPGPVSTTVRHVAGTATCPVVLVPDGPVRAGPAHRPAQVTVGVDARRPAGDAIDFAFGTARLRRARLRVLHAWALPPSAAELPFSVPEEDRAAWEDHEVQLLSDAVRPWREKYPDVRVLEDVVLFSPAEALIRNPGDAELVVIGRRHPYGNGLPAVADDLLRHTGCPVAVVPG
ncbi:universal stress protein [Streptomyces sp. CWNU-52B]|uniref:universal stress protein n=1 Tax=unclassified Streptomyces TaxID=2593676 RepID=UPI0039BF50D7